MYPASESGYRDFLAINTTFSFHIRYFIGDELVGVAVTDQIQSGLSAIYTFFEPDLSNRSLGVQSILTQLALCRVLDLPYLYLGYWVPGCSKMQYKIDYRPVELLVNGQWQRFRDR